MACYRKVISRDSWRQLKLEAGRGAENTQRYRCQDLVAKQKLPCLILPRQDL